MYADEVRIFVPVRKCECTLTTTGMQIVSGAFASCEPKGSVQDSEYFCLPIGDADVDELITVARVPADGSPEDIVSDPTLGIRSLSKRALVLEAQSPLHLVNHYPHNPFCEICLHAHLRHKRSARTTEKSDDGLPPIRRRMQRIACDLIIISKSHEDILRISADGHTCALQIRDLWSGFTLTSPLKKAWVPFIKECLKWFVGPG